MAAFTLYRAQRIRLCLKVNPGHTSSGTGIIAAIAVHLLAQFAQTV